MNASIFLFEWAGIPQKNVAEVCDLLDGTGVSTVVLGGGQGQWWQARWEDSDPMAIGSLDDFMQQTDDFRGRGIDVLPFWTPRGNPDEIAVMAPLAKRFGQIVLDLEPYEYFWDIALYPPASPTQGIRAYLKRLLDAAGDIRLHASIHISGYAWPALAVPTWLDLCTTIWPQSYWTTFQSPWKSVFNYEDNVLTTAHFPDGSDIVHTLPCDASAEDLAAAAAYRARWGESISLWSLHDATREKLEAAGAPYRNQQPVPAPLPAPAPASGSVADVITYLTSLEGVLHDDMGQAWASEITPECLVPLKAGDLRRGYDYLQRLADYCEELRNRFAEFQPQVAHQRDTIKALLGQG